MNIYTIIGFFAIMVSQERFMGVFYEKRRTSFVAMSLLYLSAIIIFVGLSLIMFGIGTFIHDVGFVLAMTVPPFIMTLNYTSLLIKRLAVVLCYFLVAEAVNLLVIPVAFFIHAFGGIDLMPFGTIFVGSLSLLATLLLRRFKNIKKDFILLPKIWIPALFVPIASVIILVFSSYVFHALIESYFSDAFSMLNTSILLWGCVFLIFFLYNTLSSAYEQKLKSALHVQEKEYYFTQCRVMQESVDKMKSYRHDVKLHLAALRDFSIENETATNYLNGLLGDLEDSEVYSDTGNVAFDSIINFKLKDVVSDSINLTAKVFVPPTLNIEVSDVVIILGNLLDNAFDAVAKVENKMINLLVESDKGNLVIKVDNTFDGEVKYTEGKSGAKKIITRKDGDNHGYGLENIQKSVEKYNGHIDITHENNIFSVGILLYVDDQQ